MKILASIIVVLFCGSLLAQNEQAIDLSNSSYVVVKYHSFSKKEAGISGLKFINTETGDLTDIKFAEHTSINTIKHINLDAVEINLVLVITGQVQRKSSEVAFESTLQIFTVDGKLVNRAIIDHQINDFVINSKTGRIVVIVDQNNFKSSTEGIEQSEMIYDLKTLRKIK